MKPGLAGSKILTRTRVQAFILLADAALIAVSLAGFYQVWNKTALPFMVTAEQGVLIISGNPTASAGIYPGDTLAAINGIPITGTEEAEVLADASPPQTPLRLTVHTHNKTILTAVFPTQYYSFFYVCVAGVTGFFFIWLAITLLIKADRFAIAITSHYMLFLTGVIMLTTWGNAAVLPVGVSVLIRGVFTFSYTIAPVCFLHLCLLFPRERAGHTVVKRALIGLYAAAVIIAANSSVAFVQFHTVGGAYAMRHYLSSFDAVRLFLVVLVIVAMLAVTIGYFRLTLLPEIKRARWLLFGFVAGPLSFALLWVLPQAITGSGLVPEEAVLLLLAIVPVSFAIAILSYRLFDIDLIIRRGFVYALALMLVSGVYILLTVLVPLLITGTNRSVLALGTMLLAAAAFAPVRDYVHRFVDRSFFRVQYDFRAAVASLLQRVRASRSGAELAANTLQFISEMLPVTDAVFLLHGTAEGTWVVTGVTGNMLRAGRVLRCSPRLLPSVPLVLAGAAEPEALASPLTHRAFRRNGICLLVPFANATGSPLGALLLGAKRSGQVYFYDDIELLRAAGLEVASALENIRLLDELVAEKLRAAELAELSRMKSYFVSLVSHELKTPLTSIKLFTELLGSPQGAAAARDEYLAIILGETERLSRLIDNILDLSRIERGIKEYSFRQEDLPSLFTYALELLEYQRKLFNAEIVTQGMPKQYLLRADADALVRVFINLLANGLKYAAEPKRITVTAAEQRDGLRLNFTNLASGITQADVQKFGTPYFRAGSVVSGIDGTGLGLSLVGPAIEAHGGTFSISGTPAGEGLTEVSFTLLFRSPYAENPPY